MIEDSSINSGAPENGTPPRLEDDPWAVLALVDLVCFYVEESPLPPS